MGSGGSWTLETSAVKRLLPRVTPSLTYVRQQWNQSISNLLRARMHYWSTVTLLINNSKWLETLSPDGFQHHSLWSHSLLHNLPSRLLLPHKHLEQRS